MALGLKVRTMHKAQAYEVLSRELQRWSSMPVAELVAHAAKPVSARFEAVGTEEIEVEVAVSWFDEEHEFIRVTARAFGASHWQTERLEESVRVRVKP
jgi:hypothetical protein